MHNYFEILDIEETFRINLELLEEKYFYTQSKYHPDRAPADKKSQYASMSSVINTAYETLKDYLKRAVHILELHGININSDSTAPKMPLDILGEILELQEDMEEDDKRDLAIEAASTKRDEILTELEGLFDEEDYERAAIRTMELKYLDKTLSAHN